MNNKSDKDVKNVGLKPNLQTNKETRKLKFKKIVLSVIFIIILFFIFLFIVLTLQPKLKIARYNHSAVMLKNGQILITGGETIKNGKPIILDSAEIYDTKTKTSILLTTKMNQKRKNHASVLLPNGDVLLIGGDGKNKTSEIYRTQLNSFENSANLHYNRRDVLGVLYNNEYVYIVDTFSPHIEMYDINKNEFIYINSFEDVLRNTYEYVNIDNNLFFPIKAIEKSAKPEITTINFFDPQKNILGVLKKKKNINTSYIDCQNNAIFKSDNKLFQICSTNQKIYVENYNFKKQCFENISNTLNVLGVNEITPVVLKSKVLILGDIYSKQGYSKKYLISYDLKNNSINFKKNCFKINKKRSKIIVDKDNAYIIGGYYVLPILGLRVVSKRIEVLK